MTMQRTTQTVVLATRAIVAGALGGALLAACGGSVPIAAPRDLAVSNGVLTWTDQSAQTASFRVERQGTSGLFEPVAVVPAGTTQYRDEAAVKPGTSYTYRVLAMAPSAPWSGAYSAQVSFTAQ
jgi:hypothetical protein